jgi:hypothetical protein
MRKQIRQGDVLLIPIEQPKGVERVLDDNGQPLQGLRVEGERTGHAHVLRARVYNTVNPFAAVAKQAPKRVLFLERPDTMTHQEHGHAPVEAGWWEPRIQREHVGAQQVNRWD